MDWRHILLLSCLLLVYLCIGAAVFQAAESDHEQMTKEHVTTLYKQFVENRSCVDEQELQEFVFRLVRSAGQYHNIRHNSSLPIWDFVGAFTFAVTVVTTIGYGHIYPATITGRAVCVLYALIGIPLIMILLKALGEKLTSIIHRTLKWRLCTDTKSQINKVFNASVVVLSGALLLFLLPALVFCHLENWQLMEALYFCFVTLSTIGFGDYIAGQYTTIQDPIWRSVYRIAVYLWILLGLSYLSLVIKYISQQYVDTAEQVHKQAKMRLSVNERRRNHNNLSPARSNADTLTVSTNASQNSLSVTTASQNSLSVTTASQNSLSVVTTASQNSITVEETLNDNGQPNLHLMNVSCVEAHMIKET